MYVITRRGSRIAGSVAVPYEAAVEVLTLIQRELRGRVRDEFEIEPAPSTTTAEEIASASIWNLAARVNVRAGLGVA